LKGLIGVSILDHTGAHRIRSAYHKELHMDVICTSIEDVRQRIDHIDRDMVALLAQRGKLVTQAAAFKKTTDDVRAPARVEQVIAKVRSIANDSGASADVVEQVYRAMIAAFIEEELNTHSTLAERS
jgi:isochorismate pyruvate lyase